MKKSNKQTTLLNWMNKKSMATSELINIFIVELYETIFHTHTG